MPRLRNLIFVLVLLALAAPTFPAGPSTRPATLPGVKNFARISPSLWRGAQPSHEGFAELKRLGVRTIVNLRTSSDRKHLKGLGLRYVHIPSVADKMDRDEIVRFLKALADPANQPVFVHCHRGADRTGCAVAAYRIVNEGWSVEDALAEMPLFKFNRKYKGIVQELRKLDPGAIKAEVDRAKSPKVRVVR